MKPSFHRPTKHLNIDNKEYNTKFVMRHAKREDSGEYTITAQNSSGKDTVTVNVTVTDKPGKPEGPLKVSSRGTVCTTVCRFSLKLWRSLAVSHCTYLHI